MNWSITWIIIPIIISIFNDKRRRKRLKRRDLIREAAAGSERDVILENIGDLPAWVSIYYKYKIEQLWDFFN